MPKYEVTITQVNDDGEREDILTAKTMDKLYLLGESTRKGERSEPSGEDSPAGATADAKPATQRARAAWDGESEPTEVVKSITAAQLARLMLKGNISGWAVSYLLRGAMTEALALLQREEIEL